MTETMLMMARQASANARSRQSDAIRSRMQNARPAASPRAFPPQQQLLKAQQTVRPRQVGKSAISIATSLPKPPSALGSRLPTAPPLIEHCGQVNLEKQKKQEQVLPERVEKQQREVEPASPELPSDDQILSAMAQSRLILTDQPVDSAQLQFKSEPSAKCLAVTAQADRHRRGGVNPVLCHQLAVHLAECLVPAQSQQGLYHPKRAAPVSRFQFDTPSPDDRVLQAVANRPKLQLHVASAASQSACVNC
ncbi:hypothetical protein BOX15_Mlig028961g3 [Macrostomum lignano]|uniref:Uncharacterized protein n=1 Tax=Macrostomum lignano TaxID=282301 RepID=A0A267DSF4_9PLAT|nr:hypothetical protein BOX15_Mlig028961g3 [Macrostomum lignano]